MASSVNITVEDTSPLISYQPALAWTESLATDPLALQSSASSFRTTSQPGATASVLFSGTGISIFGSTGPSHGQYSVSIDGGVPQVLSGSTLTTVAKAPLFKTSGLAPGDHTVVITNNGVNGQPGALDIDFMQVEAALSQPVIIDDAAIGSGVSFVPADASWGVNNQAAFLDGTSHATLTPNARFIFNFNGAGVALYGSVSSARSPYSVTIDGKSSTFTPSATGSHSQALLFFESNLTPGPHQLIMTNDALDGTRYMDFDFAQVYQAATVPDELPAPTPATSLPADSSGTGGSDVSRVESNGSDDSSVMVGVVKSGPRFSPVVIVGITFGALLGLCILIAALVMLLKLRRRSTPSSSANYPFGGMDGSGDRFKKAPVAERGALPVAPPAPSYDDSTLTENEKVPATQGRPSVLKIVTDFSAPAPVPVAKQQPVVPAISAKPSNVEVLMTHMRSPSASSAGSAGKPAMLIKSPPAHARTGSKSQTTARAPPVITSLAAAARNPAIMQTTSSDKPEAGKPDSLKVPRKAVPAMASTAPAVAPQRPPVRPPFIALEPDVKGPDRPSRPQTQLMLSPAVPVATRTFGEGRSEGGRI